MIADLPFFQAAVGHFIQEQCSLLLLMQPFPLAPIKNELVNFYYRYLLDIRPDIPAVLRKYHMTKSKNTRF
jgi:hypothetical protein